MKDFEDDTQIKMGYLFTDIGDSSDAVIHLKTGHTIDICDENDVLYVRLQPDHIRLIYGWLLQDEMKHKMINDNT